MSLSKFINDNEVRIYPYRLLKKTDKIEFKDNQIIVLQLRNVDDSECDGLKYDSDSRSYYFKGITQVNVENGLEGSNTKYISKSTFESNKDVYFLTSGNEKLMNVDGEFDDKTFFYTIGKPLIPNDFNENRQILFRSKKVNNLIGIKNDGDVHAFSSEENPKILFKLSPINDVLNKYSNISTYARLIRTEDELIKQSGINIGINNYSLFGWMDIIKQNKSINSELNETDFIPIKTQILNQGKKDEIYFDWYNDFNFLTKKTAEIYAGSAVPLSLGQTEKALIQNLVLITAIERNGFGGVPMNNSGYPSSGKLVGTTNIDVVNVFRRGSKKVNTDLIKSFIDSSDNDINLKLFRQTITALSQYIDSDYTFDDSKHVVALPWYLTANHVPSYNVVNNGIRLDLKTPLRFKIESYWFKIDGNTITKPDNPNPNSVKVFDWKRIDINNRLTQNKSIKEQVDQNIAVDIVDYDDSTYKKNFVYSKYSSQLLEKMYNQGEIDISSGTPTNFGPITFHNIDTLNYKLRVFENPDPGYVRDVISAKTGTPIEQIQIVNVGRFVKKRTATQHVAPKDLSIYQDPRRAAWKFLIEEIFGGTEGAKYYNQLSNEVASKFGGSYIGLTGDWADYNFDVPYYVYDYDLEGVEYIVSAQSVIDTSSYRKPKLIFNKEEWKNYYNFIGGVNSSINLTPKYKVEQYIDEIKISGLFIDNIEMNNYNLSFAIKSEEDKTVVEYNILLL